MLVGVAVAVVVGVVVVVVVIDFWAAVAGSCSFDRFETFNIATFQQCKILLQPMSEQLVLFCMSLKVKTICLRPSDSSVPSNARQT